MQELRLGICSCATRYHGQLNGVTISIPVSFMSVPFRIREVIMPSEESERVALKENRCHFFLDAHRYSVGNEPKRWETSLDRIVILSNGEGRGEKLFIGNLVRQRDRREITKSRPASAAEISTALVSLLACLRPAKIAAWIDQMG